MIERFEKHLLVGASAALLLVQADLLQAQDPRPEEETTRQQAKEEENSELLQAADEVLAEIVRLRGLEPKSPVPRGVEPRSAIRQYAIAQMAKDYPPERLENDRRAYVLLGLLSPDVDLNQAIIDLLTDQIAGFYDTDTQTFHIADWIPDSMQRPVMAHELMHALQDQHFDLDAMMDAAKDDEDRLLALESLVEGEGVAVMFDYMLQPVGTRFQFLPGLDEFIQKSAGVADSASEVFARSPAFLRNLLTFPYSYGTGFLQYFRKRHGWEEMAGVYAAPPLSSEQILHPERYFEDRDDPTPVAPLESPPSPIPGDWPRIHQGVLGEFTIWQALTPFTDEDTARKAAQGWDGDRFELYEGPRGRLALVLRTVWDSPEEAGEYFEAQLAALQKRYPPSGDVEEGLEGDGRRAAWASPAARIELKGQALCVQLIQLEAESKTAEGGHDH